MKSVGYLMTVFSVFSHTHVVICNLLFAQYLFAQCRSLPIPRPSQWPYVTRSNYILSSNYQSCWSYFVKNNHWILWRHNGRSRIT